MAKAKESSSTVLRSSVRRKRKGVHSKKKTAKIKSSKNYRKLYGGQGR